MKRTYTTLLLSLFGASALLLSGCSWTQRGAAAGGALGSAVGGVWGYSAATYLTTAQCALIGGAAGGGAGAIGGSVMDQAKARSDKRELDNLRAQLTDRENELAQLRAGSDPRVSELQQKAAELQAQLDAANNQAQQMSSAAGDKAQLEAQLAELNRQKEEAQANAAKLIDQNASMTDRMNQLQQETDALRQQIATKEASLASLQEKAGDVDALRKQLADLNVQLEETNRGLTLTILDQLLYKPGSASLSTDGKTLIAKVSDIIQTQFPGREIIVEGHTDNQPIRFSKWASNWELGSARALAVVHCMVQEHGFEPTKISAVSYGEFRPAADNSTSEGRGLNRRSVIVILPENMPFQKQVAAVGGN